jgi:hypothetical protein
MALGEEKGDADYMDLVSKAVSGTHMLKHGRSTPPQVEAAQPSGFTQIKFHMYLYDLFESYACMKPHFAFECWKGMDFVRADVSAPILPEIQASGLTI